jgi:biofilm PGA synthesis N-glycosyltransferase PgaC
VNTWPPKIVALIPAHDEEEQIAATIEAIRAQTVPVARIIVVADNCSDATAAVAAAVGAEVFASVDNRARKAGALNQGFPLVDDDCDYLLQTDADTILDREFVASAIWELERNAELGGVCARFLTKECRGFLPLLQRMEYQRLDRHTTHSRHRIHCLSGTATVVRYGILPARPWSEQSLVEDYALSLDLVERGWKIKRADYAIAWTETKPTLAEFWAQRLRWAKGTLDELAHRGWQPHTRRAIGGQVWAYVVVTLRWLWLSGLAANIILWGATFSKIWLLPLPIVLAERVRSVWPLGWKARALASTWLADEFYQLLWEGYMLHALWASWRKRAIAW